MDLVMGMMLAGFDDEGPKLIYVDSEGMRSHGQVFSVGSGSPYALGVLDTGYRHDLSDQEAYDLARRAIYHATSKDAYSGGIVRLYHINSTGWRNICNTDCSELHDSYCGTGHLDKKKDHKDSPDKDLPCSSGWTKRKLTEDNVQTKLETV